MNPMTHGIRLGLVLAVLAQAFALAARAGEIHEAVKTRDLDKIKSLLQASPKLVNQANETGDVPLYIAIFRGDRVLVDLLLTNKAEVDLPANSRGETLLSVAVELGHKSIANSLRKAGAREDDASRGAAIRHAASRGLREELAVLLAANSRLVNAPDGMGNTALYLAAYTNNKEIVSALLTAKADPNAANKAGGTPYSIARERDDAVVVELLRKAGGRENRITDGLPIRQAARKGDVEKARELLKARPELATIRDDLDKTALHEAALMGSTSVAALLLENKADVDARDFSRTTPLIAAAGTGQAGAVDLLIAHKADVNARTKQNTTALISAAAHGHQAVVQSLLDHGADVLLTDNLGMTALHWAAANGQSGAAVLLVARKSPVNLADNRGNTPLGHAASRGRKEVVVALLEQKADVNVRNKEGFTPVTLAMRGQQMEIAALLRQHGGKE